MKSDDLPPPRRPLRKGLFFLLVSCLVCCALFFLILFTEPGFQFMLRTADKLSGPVFSVQEVQGHLLSRWRLGKVKVHIDKKIDLARWPYCKKDWCYTRSQSRDWTFV